MVNKQEFISKAAEKSGFTKVDTKAFVNAMESVIFLIALKNMRI